MKNKILDFIFTFVGVLIAVFCAAALIVTPLAITVAGVQFLMSVFGG